MADNAVLSFPGERGRRAMGASNFSEDELLGESEEFQRVVCDLRARHGFDFVSLGLTPYVGAPLKWVYSDGATSERHRRISLAPGHGIGGIVLKAGKPMMFSDIDKQIDPREYSSYPIVFAEDLRSFCALPLVKGDRTVAVLLVAFRTVDEGHEESYLRLIEDLGGSICGMKVISDGFLGFDGTVEPSDEGTGGGAIAARSDLSCTIAAQEDERKRISRELHDGIAQELLGVSFSLGSLEGHVDGEGEAVLAKTRQDIDRILDEIHDIAVTLRPSALDNLGFVAALHSQALLYERSYGVETVFSGELSCERFDPAFEVQAYRICQEAILNACKYSGEDRVYVDLEDSGGWLHVSVVDHGVGFDTGKPVVKGSGCGLSGMRERASIIGATLTTESGPEGTVVTLVAPMGLDGEPPEAGVA